MRGATLLAALAVLGLLTGCADRARPTGGGDRSFTPGTAESDPARYQGKVVEWGGLLIASHNFRDRTELEILALPLQGNGRPERDGRSSGRFIAVRPGYLETGELAPGRSVTVVGPVTGVRTGQVGQASYRYPEVEIRDLYVWPVEPAATQPAMRFGVGVGSWGSGVGVGIGF